MREPVKSAIPPALVRWAHSATLFAQLPIPASSIGMKCLVGTQAIGAAGALGATYGVLPARYTAKLTIDLEELKRTHRSLLARIRGLLRDAILPPQKEVYQKKLDSILEGFTDSFTDADKKWLAAYKWGFIGCSVLSLGVAASVAERILTDDDEELAQHPESSFWKWFSPVAGLLTIGISTEISERGLLHYSRKLSQYTSINNDLELLFIDVQREVSHLHRLGTALVEAVEDDSSLLGQRK